VGAAAVHVRGLKHKAYCNDGVADGAQCGQQVLFARQAWSVLALLVNNVIHGERVGGRTQLLLAVVFLLWLLLFLLYQG
jgi:hypothetical protein